MSRIQDTFKVTQPFIGYVIIGDGGLENTLEYVKALVAGGVDIIELGVPFSDPIADGPVIQQGVGRALKSGVSPQHILNLVEQIREATNVPIILMSYYNPIITTGSSFLEEAKIVGADGMIIVDLPIEEAHEYKTIMDTIGLDTIFLTSPSTPASRLKKIEYYSSGFIYYACQKGTTGMKSKLPEDFEHKIAEIRKETSLPIAIGFGISNRETAKQILKYADGFIVGSYFVKAIGDGVSTQALTNLAKTIDPRGK